MIDIASLVLTGILLGSLYGLFGVGLVVIYRAADVLNFSMASLTTASVFLATTLLDRGLPVAGAVAIGVLAAGLLGVAIELVIIRPLGPRSHFAALIAMFALSFALVGLIGLVWGAQPRSFPDLVTGSTTIFGRRVANQRLAGGVYTMLMVALLSLYFRGRRGREMLATAADAEAARMVGVDTRAAARRAWFLGCGLASSCAFLLASESIVDVGLMDGVMIRSFAGVFLGGYTMVGAGIGGLTVGVLDNLLSHYVSTTYRNTFVFLTIAISLLLKPSGLLGRAAVERA